MLQPHAYRWLRYPFNGYMQPPIGIAGAHSKLASLLETLQGARQPAVHCNLHCPERGKCEVYAKTRTVETQIWPDFKACIKLELD